MISKRKKLKHQQLEPRYMLDSTVVFNELMYHPVSNDTEHEWIELRNLLSVDMDLSGWAIQNGIQYQFADNTKIPADGFLVVALDPDTMANRDLPVEVLGPYSGMLSNGGDEIELWNNSQRIMDRLQYDDMAPWPVAPDGIGFSLAKTEPYWTSRDAENWRASPQRGGTPGTPNFPVPDLSPREIIAIPRESTWNYHDQDIALESSWNQTDFNDTDWPKLAAPFLAGESDELGDMGIRIVALDDQDDAGIDNRLDFTHAYDFGSQSPTAEINGVSFQRATSSNLTTLPNLNWHNTSGVRSQSTNGLSKLKGPLRQLMEDYVINTFNVANGTVMLTLTGLSPGTQYATRIFSRRFDDRDRMAAISFDVNGDAIADESITINQTTPTAAAFALSDPDQAYFIEFGFVAESPELTINVDQQNFNRAWAFYGLTNHVAGGGDESVITEGPTTHYFRNEFEYRGNGNVNHEVHLDLSVDDGAIVYLNGNEAYRYNMPDGEIDHAASAIENILQRTPIRNQTLDPLLLNKNGSNTLAVEVHQNVQGNLDLFFDASLAIAEFPNPVGENPPILLNELSQAGPFHAIEIINVGDAELDLTNFELVHFGNRENRFSLRDTLPAQSVKSFTFAIPADEGDAIALFHANGSLLDANKVAKTTVARSTTDQKWYATNSPSFGSANSTDIESAIVINEIMYHAPANYRHDDQPFSENPEEWIEIYNRSNHPIDLSHWRFDGGIGYEFPSGTMIEADTYLVVANDQANLNAKYPMLHSMGNFKGSLGDGGDLLKLQDPLGNDVDAVEYFDRGYWPDDADGGGSSLELVSPNADNATSSAWQASVRPEADWHQVSYEGLATDPPRSNDPRLWHEFVFGLLDKGEILIDDISVIEDPDGDAIEVLQNGSFDRGTDSFRILGTHGQHGLTQIIDDPEQPGNRVLHLVATGATEHMNNHVETTFANGRETDRNRVYRISFRAKWLAGSPQLNTRLYFNRLAKTTILPIPEKWGTPGAVNSRFMQNMGPTFSNLRHSPVVPDAGEDISVFISATDIDGIEKIELKYSVDGGAFRTVEMSRRKAHLIATIPGQASESVVQFYVEATDARGATGHFPADGIESRALIKVNDRAATTSNRHNFRIIMTESDLDEQFTPTNFTSNLRMGATVVWQEQQVYYDVGVRLKGSGFSRGSGATGFNLRFQPDKLLFGEHDVVAVDRQGGPWGIGASHREMTIKHIANRAGNIPMMYDDIIHLIGPLDRVNGSAQLLTARYDDVFLDSQFENGGEGTRFKYELVYFSSVTVDRTPEGIKRPPGVFAPGVFGAQGVDMPIMGDNSDNYRWNFLIKNNRDRDDYSRMLDLVKAMNASSTSVGGARDLLTQEVMDVDQWMRVFAFESLAGINDTYNQGLPHNLQLYVRPSDNRVLALPWDMDFALHHGTNLGIYGSGSRLRRVINIPSNRRLFQQHLLDMLDTSYNTEYLSPWVRHLATLAERNETNAILAYVRDRGRFVRDRLPNQIPFAITTNGGMPITIDDDAITLTGTGWIDVRQIRLAGSSRPLAARWIDDDKWEADIPLIRGTQLVSLEAYNLRDELVGTAQVDVTSTTNNPIVDSLRTSEIHFNPAAPTEEERRQGFENNNLFEFLELTNIGAVAIELEGVSFQQTDVDGDQQGIDFTFGPATLDVNETMVVVKNIEAFQIRYGDNVSVAGEFNGQLSNAGEILTLHSSSGHTIQQFAYDDSWFPETDGDGHSLEAKSPATTPNDAWHQKSSWRPSRVIHGSPGFATSKFDLNHDGHLSVDDVDQLCENLNSNSPEFDINNDGGIDDADIDFLLSHGLGIGVGDVNGDGIFNSRDLVLIFQAGEFEDDIAANSLWSEGDWNCDQEFTTADLVLAFQSGNFVRESSPVRGSAH